MSIPPSLSDYRAIDFLKQSYSASTSHHRHIWIITGPVGCGKSTIAQYLAHELLIPYIKGDDVSVDELPAANPLASLVTDTIVPLDFQQATAVSVPICCR